jgi:hypothetical protein
MAKGRLRKAWDIYRHIAAFRGLLQWIGWWKYVVIGVSVMGGAIVTTIESSNSLSWPIRLLVFGGVFVALVFVLLQIAIFLRALEAAEMQTVEQTTHVPIEGPEVVLDYFFEDRNRDTISSEIPLTIKNISATAAAYNVDVLPLQIEGMVCSFTPQLIPNIPAQGSTNVFADDRNGSILLRRSFPIFLYRSSYKDQSTDELFGVKCFPMRIRYTNASGTTRFETVADVCFRAWKRETCIGKTERRTI